ncbi:MAG TPA: branched-chain amino acid ABC transporter substrate-binding protein [Chloroflexota bacterium]|nr:branched-chain amino acid ABC transporter substrate-binding protein [Chloroflexota bacterium]
MKRVLYLASSVALLASMVLAGNALAAHPSAKAKTITVRLCSSGPLAVPALHQLWQGVNNGINVAIKQWKPKLSKVHVKVQPLLVLDDGNALTNNYDTSKEAANADTCNATKNTVGYIGTLNSGAAEVSEPRLNRDHMLMISPANTNPTLTSPKSRKAQEPLTYAHKIPYVTYYRTVTTDKLQGPAGADFAKKVLKKSTYFLVDDGTLYGEGLATYFKAEAKKKGMKIVGSGRIDSTNSGTQSSTSLTIAQEIKAKNPSMVYCGCNSNTANDLPKDLRTVDGYKKTFMGGDALYNTAWLSSKNGGAGAGATNNDATSVGPDPSKAAKTFKKLYKKDFPSFYKNPGIQAYDAPAYDAASIALMGVYDAAKAGKLKGGITKERDAVVKYVHSITFKGATGTTRFDKNGDTTNKIISIYATQKVKGNLTWVFKKQLKPSGSPT